MANPDRLAKISAKEKQLAIASGRDPYAPDSGNGHNRSGPPSRGGDFRTRGTEQIFNPDARNRLIYLGVFRIGDTTPPIPTVNGRKSKRRTPNGSEKNGNTFAETVRNHPIESALTISAGLATLAACAPDQNESQQPTSPQENPTVIPSTGTPIPQTPSGEAPTAITRPTSETNAEQENPPSTDLSVKEQQVVQELINAGLYNPQDSQITQADLPDHVKKYMNLRLTINGFTPENVLGSLDDPFTEVNYGNNIALYSNIAPRDIEIPGQPELSPEIRGEVVRTGENDNNPVGSIMVWTGPADFNWVTPEGATPESPATTLDEALENVLIYTPSADNTTIGLATFPLRDEEQYTGLAEVDSEGNLISYQDAAGRKAGVVDDERVSKNGGVSPFVEYLPHNGEPDPDGNAVYHQGLPNQPLPELPTPDSSYLADNDPENGGIFAVTQTQEGETQKTHQVVQNEETGELGWEEIAEELSYFESKEQDWVEMGYLPDDGVVHEITRNINGQERDFYGFRNGSFELHFDKEFAAFELEHGFPGKKESGEIIGLSPEIDDAEQRMERIGYFIHAVNITEKAVEMYGEEGAKERGMYFLRREQTEYDPTWYERYIEFIDSHEEPIEYEMKGYVNNDGKLSTELIGVVDAKLPVVYRVLPPVLERDHARENGIVGGHPQAPFGLDYRMFSSGFYDVDVDQQNGVLMLTDSTFLVDGKMMSAESFPGIFADVAGLAIDEPHGRIDNLRLGPGDIPKIIGEVYDILFMQPTPDSDWPIGTFQWIIPNNND